MPFLRVGMIHEWHDSFEIRCQGDGQLVEKMGRLL